LQDIPDVQTVMTAFPVNCNWSKFCWAFHAHVRCISGFKKL